MTEFIPTHKICSCCRGDLPLEDFYPSDSGMFGVTNNCKVCGSYKNHNRARIKKGLPPLSLEEYKQHKKSSVRSRKEEARRVRMLGKKIEALFVIRWEKAFQAHRDKWWRENFNK